MNWINFLSEHSIEYTTSGHGIAGSNVAIQPCPYCGHNGRPFHLHISLEGKGFKCWRTDNKGNDATLIKKLLNCSWQEANHIAGKVSYLSNDFAAQVANILNPNNRSDNSNILKLPAEFKPLSDKPSCRSYIKYLASRGFTDIKLLRDKFNIHYCTQGPFHSRLIFPIYMNGKLVSWTGRAIYKKMELRYKTLSHNPKPGLPTALMPIKHCLLYYDNLFKWFANTLIVTEGPFDSLGINILGKNKGVISTCLFGNSISNVQIELLRDLAPLFKHRYIILDKDSEVLATLKIAPQLRALEFQAKLLPPGIKDPATLLDLTF